MHIASFLFGFLCFFALSARSQVVEKKFLKPSSRPTVQLTTDTLSKNIELVIEWQECGVRLALLKIPAGEFLMGTENGDPDEKPIHTVNLDTFWIGKYEVTAQQFAMFLNALGHDRTKQLIYLDTRNPVALIQRIGGEYTPLPGFEEFPAAGVTWYGAKVFCDWLRKEGGLPFDLPTEAQWEKAARGDLNDQRIFPWGIRLNPRLAHYKSDQPAVVGSYPKGVSPYGAYDMAGNATEWVRDWYRPDYYRRSPRRNPSGASTGTLKILRGGDWSVRMFTIPQLRSADRNPKPPASGDLTMGFRVSLDGDFHLKLSNMLGTPKKNPSSLSGEGIYQTNGDLLVQRPATTGSLGCLSTR